MKIFLANFTVTFVLCKFMHFSLSGFLPPANEVCGKVILSEVRVILFTGEGVSMMSLAVWLPVPIFLPGDLCLWSHVPFGGGGGSLSGRPPYGKELVVHILLECFF